MCSYNMSESTPKPVEELKTTKSFHCFKSNFLLQELNSLNKDFHKNHSKVLFPKFLL